MKAHARRTPEPRRYFKEVRFRQIRALVEVARRRSFAVAAKSLGMATPSVWRQVRALEEEYAVQLVVARGSRLQLTAEGDLLVQLATPLVEGFDSLREVFADRQDQAPRQLRVATPAPILENVLREVIVTYRKEHPEVRLALQAVPSRLAAELLEEDKADLAIVGHPIGADHSSRLEATPLVRYPMQLACLRTHPLARVRRLTLQNLIGCPLVLAGESSSSRMQFETVIAQAGLRDRVNITMTASSLSLILNYVAIGFGSAIITVPACEAAFPAKSDSALVFRDVSHLFGSEQVTLLNHKGRHDLPHIAVFRAQVIEAMGVGDKNSIRR